MHHHIASQHIRLASVQFSFKKDDTLSSIIINSAHHTLNESASLHCIYSHQSQKAYTKQQIADEAHVLFEFVKCELYIYFVSSSISLHQQRKSNALLSKQIAIGRANIFDDSQCAWPSTPIRRQFNSVLSLCFVCSGEHMHATTDNKCHFNLDKSNKVGANVIRTLKHEQTNHTL